VANYIEYNLCILLILNSSFQIIIALKQNFTLSVSNYRFLNKRVGKKIQTIIIWNGGSSYPLSKYTSKLCHLVQFIYFNTN
jgi:hypothetical protein